MANYFIISSHHSGNDDGRVYGALITGAANPPSSGSRTAAEHTQTTAGRKRGRKRHRKRKRTSNLSSTDSGGRPLPSSLDSSSSRPHAKDEFAHSNEVASGSLGLLTAYGDSSGTDSDSKRCDKDSRQRLAIPAAIEGMFEDKDSVSSEEKTESFLFHTSAGEGSHLGFFGEESLSDEEVRTKPKGMPSGKKAESDHRVVSKKWSEGKGQWIFGESELSSYTCWKCSNVGHLAEDCTVSVHRGEVGGGGRVKVKVPRSLQVLYATCREIRGERGQRCADCGVHSNLACCVDCR